MTVSAASLRKLAALNLAPAQMAGVLDMLADQQEQEDARKAAQRERTRRSRAKRDSNVTVTPQSQDGNAHPLSPKEIPQTPLEITPYPKTPSPPKGGSFPAGFELFWEMYPNKVGKPVAAKKFSAALRVASLETIMDGLSAYVAKTDDRPWCNPATWLHQQRWGDKPAEVARGSPAFSKPDHYANLTQELIDEQNRSDRSDSRDWDDAQGFPQLTIDHHR